MSYKAPKPTKTKWTWAKIIGLRVIFPPVLLWDALKFGVNKLVGEKVGKLVLPAQNIKQRDDYNDSREQFEKLIKSNSSRMKILTVETHDDAKLDTLEIKSQNKKNSDKYIINFLANSDCYELHYDEMVNDSNKCNVIGFNYRGVNESSGAPKSSNDLVIDGIAQVQRLLKDGVKPEHIVLKGHSLGAGIATLVAKHFYDHGIKIRIFDSRAFSTFTNAIVGFVRTMEITDKMEVEIKKYISETKLNWIKKFLGLEEGKNKTGHQETFRKKLVGWIINPFVKFSLAIAGWEIDVASAYKALPDTHKEYIVVRSSKADRKTDGNTRIDDAIVSHYASLHAALKSERRKLKARDPENKERLKERKMVVKNPKNKDGHNVSPICISSNVRFSK